MTRGERDRRGHRPDAQALLPCTVPNPEFENLAASVRHLTPREAGLYFLKFFIELHLHAPSEISGRMVWFSASKAAALLRRRGLPGTVGLRC